MEQIKVAVIGCGTWGFYHARAYHENKQTKLCAVVGRSEEKTAARAAQFSVPYYLDIDEMLEKERPDFVSVCLPSLSAAAPTMQVIRAGFPLLVEKPLAYTLPEAQALIDAAKARGLFMGIDFNHRFSIPAKLAKEAMEGGKVGSVSYAVWQFGHGWGGSMAHPHVNLIGAQCHGFNFLEAYCGRIRSVMAQMSDKSGKGGYSTFVLALEFASGALGAMICSLDASFKYPHFQTIEFNGEKGRILIEDNVQRYTYQAKDSPLCEQWNPGFFMDKERSFSHNTDRLIAETVSALIDGKAPPVPAEEGLRALELAYAAIESFETGTRVFCG